MMRLRLMLGAAIVAGAIVAATYMVGYRGDYLWDLFILIPMVLLTCGVFIAGPGVRAFAELFRVPESGGPDRNRRTAMANLRLLNRTLVLGALMGFMIKFIWMLKDLSAPEEVWQELSRAFVPALWALIIHICLAIPLGHGIAEERKEVPTDGKLRRDSGQKDAPWTVRRALLGEALIAAAIVLFNAASFRGGLLYDLPAALLAIFVPIGIAMAAFGPGSLGRAFGALRAPEGTGGAGLAAARSVFATLGRVFRATAVLGFPLGTVSLLYNAFDRSQYGPSLALALLCALYSAVLIAMVALPFEAAAERRQLQGGNE